MVGKGMSWRGGGVPLHGADVFYAGFFRRDVPAVEDGVFARNHHGVVAGAQGRAGELAFAIGKQFDGVVAAVGGKSLHPDADQAHGLSVFVF